MNQIEIYKTQDGETQIEVQFEQDTVWLTQQQITTLFQRDRTVITKHIINVFKEGELDENSNVQKMHIPNSDKPVSYYNLEVIISIGYRVKSEQGTQFRQWATQRLKDHLIKGYSINQERLQQLQQTIQLIHQSGTAAELNLPEAKGLLDIITNYTQSFILLNRFDSNNLSEERLNENITYAIKYNDAIDSIEELKKQFAKKKEVSALFGNQEIKALGHIKQHCTNF